MTFTDGDAYCEDMDPENLAVVNTAKEPSAVGKWENRNDNIFEEEFNNVEDLCEDMEPGNLVTNEEAKDPTFIDKYMDMRDGYSCMKEVYHQCLFPTYGIAEGPSTFEQCLTMIIELDAFMEPGFMEKLYAIMDIPIPGKKSLIMGEKSLIMGEDIPIPGKKDYERVKSLIMGEKSQIMGEEDYERMKSLIMGEEDFERMQEAFDMKERKRLFKVILNLLAYIVILCSILSKSALQKQLRFKHSFGEAALLLLWNSGDVEKHPGPPFNVMKTIRELVTRLVKEVQGKKVVDWATAPPGWDENVVSFKNINNLKDSNNAQKFAMFFEALGAYIKMFGHVPDWCVEEMTYVETGNVLELHKCQKARKIRELLEHESPAHREDILGMAGYPRQGGSVPDQAVKTANRNQQSRPDKCPFNVPGYRPISTIKESETARIIAKGFIAQSQNAGKFQSENHQTMTKKRVATTTTVQPAPKQARTSAANTSTRQATSTIVRPNTASPAISIATSTQPALTVSIDSQSAAPTIVTTSTYVATNTGASLQIAHNCVVGPANVSQKGRPGQPTTQHAQNAGPTGTINGFVLIFAQPVVSATASPTRLPAISNIVRPTTSTDSAGATACYTGSHSSTFCTSRTSNKISTGTLPSTAQISQQPNYGGHPSNDISTGTPPTTAQNSQQLNNGGQPLPDLGFIPDADFL